MWRSFVCEDSTLGDQVFFLKGTLPMPRIQDSNQAVCSVRVEADNLLKVRRNKYASQDTRSAAVMRCPIHDQRDGQDFECVSESNSYCVELENK